MENEKSYSGPSNEASFTMIPKLGKDSTNVTYEDRGKNPTENIKKYNSVSEKTGAPQSHEDKDDLIQRNLPDFMEPKLHFFFFLPSLKSQCVFQLVASYNYIAFIPFSVVYKIIHFTVNDVLSSVQYSNAKPHTKRLNTKQYHLDGCLKGI